MKEIGQDLPEFIVTFAKLQVLCKPNGPPPQKETVKRWCERQGIRYLLDGEGGPWTTITALNYALGIRAVDDESPYRVEDLIR